MMTFSESMHGHASAYLRHALHRSRGNVKEAAKAAGMHRTQFYRLCQRCQINIQAIRDEPLAQTQQALLTRWQLPRGLTWSP